MENIFQIPKELKGKKAVPFISLIMDLQGKPCPYKDLFYDSILRIAEFYNQPFNVKMLIENENLKGLDTSDAIDELGNMSLRQLKEFDDNQIFEGFKLIRDNCGTSYQFDYNDVDISYTVPSISNLSYRIHGEECFEFIGGGFKSLDEFIILCKLVDIELKFK